MKQAIIFNLVLFLAVSTPTIAATRLVPADYPNIQSAIDDCNDGDEVVVVPGTYTGNGNRDIDFLGKAITVKSENGPETCIIDIDASQADWHKGFYLHEGEGRTSIIEGFTIKGGYAYRGAGICCENSSPNIENCIITGNTGGWGGGIRYYKSNAIIGNCLIIGNKGWDAAGGISCRDSSLKITNCTISNNISYYGGGILCQEASLTVTNCIFWGNSPGQIADRGSDSVILVSYSNIEDGWLGLGNIDCDPCFAEPGYWDDNDTPSNIEDDLWIDGDYHLRSAGWRWDTQRELWTWDEVTSRCIDAGNPGSSLGEEPLAVPDDPNNEWGENLRINMGAYGGTAEASIPPYDWALLADITNDGTADFTDLKYFSEDWLNTESGRPADLNRDSSIDMFDYALFAEDWLVEIVWDE